MAAVSVEETILRLVFAALLAGLIGWERESHHRPAGLRTHILVCVGAAVLMVVSQDMYFQFRDTFADPGRIAAQVVSGIGFLGAGTILREGANVRGLTTAASLWVAAAIGLAVGAGAYVGAVTTTAITLMALIWLGRWERRRLRGGRIRHIKLRVTDRPGLLGEIGSQLGNRQINIRNIEMQPVSLFEGGGSSQLDIEVTVEMPPKGNVAELLELMQGMEGVQVIESSEA